MRRSKYGRQAWDRAAEAVAWPKGGRNWQWTFHSLRHVFATWARRPVRSHLRGDRLASARFTCGRRCRCPLRVAKGLRGVLRSSSAASRSAMPQLAVRPAQQSLMLATLRDGGECLPPLLVLDLLSSGFGVLS
jgi:hypothetical protein